MLRDQLLIRSCPNIPKAKFDVGNENWPTSLKEKVSQQNNNEVEGLIVHTSSRGVLLTVIMSVVVKLR